MTLLVSLLLVLVLMVVAFQTMLGLRPRPWRGPDFLDPTGKKAERQRRRSAAIVEAAVLLALYPMLIRIVGLRPELAIIVLGASCVGLFFMPNVTRTATGILAGFLAIITTPWQSIGHGPAAVLMITGYLILAAHFAPNR